MIAATALSTNANGLAKPAALFLGAEVGVLPAAPEPDEAPLEPDPAVVDDAEPAVLVRVAMLMVVLRAIAVPVPAETAVPPMVVVGMLELKLARIELTVPFKEAMTELTDALEEEYADAIEEEEYADAIEAELVADAEDCADAEPPESEI